ncbi:MAG: hypothetical protein EBY50_06680 [Rhodobacteraceae bacterium]|nr:hypothetical protein [Paracoccaceae bacterium]
MMMASTGVIGEPLNDDLIKFHLKKLWDSKGEADWYQAATAIKTTDTFSKVTSQIINIDGSGSKGEIIPGFSENIETEFTLNPEDFLSRYLSPYGAGFSLEPRIFQSAWFRPHNISEDFENLYLVGAGTHPGAGIPSVVTSSEVLNQLVPDAVEKV